MGESKRGATRRSIYLGVGLALAWGTYTVLEAAHVEVPAGVRDAILALAAVLAVTFIDRAFLLREFARWHTASAKDLEDRTREAQSIYKSYLAQSQKLTEAAQSCSLTAVWPQRRGAAAEEIRSAVRAAGSRVWLLGVAFADSLSLDELLNVVAENEADNEVASIDLKILLMDPLHGAAVYRTLLESADVTLEQILNADRPSALDPLFNQRHFPSFQRNLGALQRRPDCSELVRFYSHNPSCWLVICDNVAFFELYTFGVEQSAGGTSGICMGALMPVFKFEDQNGEAVFSLLEQHFRKTWLTAETGMVHAEGRLRHATAIFERMFRPQERGMWLEQIAKSLQASRARPGEFKQRVDPRAVPRRRCNWSGQVQMTWTSDGRQRSALATVRDYSERGVGVVLADGSDQPGEQSGLRLTLDGANPGAAEDDLTADWEVRRLLGGESRECVVGWSDLGDRRLGLAFGQQHVSAPEQSTRRHFSRSTTAPE